jgi:DNA-directed RNA polymerase beta subunit
MTLARDVVRFGDYLPSTEKSYAKIPQIMEMPNLIKVQLDSYEWFKREGLRELLDEISPIQDFTGSKMELRFGEYSFGEPKYSEDECRNRDATFAAPLRVKVELSVKETGEVKEQELFMGDFPLMTPTGTFIINGAERVVVSQLVRSPGVYFTREKDPTTAATSRSPRSSLTAAPGWSLRRPTETLSPSRWTASARSPSPHYCAQLTLRKAPRTANSAQPSASCSGFRM